MSHEMDKKWSNCVLLLSIIIYKDESINQNIISSMKHSLIPRSPSNGASNIHGPTNEGN